MTPKQKVLSIRLAELIIKNHTFAKSIGLEVKNKFEKKSKEENWWLLEKTISDCRVGTFEKTRGLPAGSLRNPNGRDARSDKKIGTLRKDYKKK